MSEPARRDTFEARVGQVIDPIPASQRRKRAMREELLAHLIGVYEEELGESGSARVAMDLACARFGEVEAVRQELRETVPLVERLICLFLSPWEPVILRWILVGIAVTVMGIGIVLPALAKLKSGASLTSMGAYGVVMLSIGVALVILGLGTIGYKLARR